MLSVRLSFSVILILFLTACSDSSSPELSTVPTANISTSTIQTASNSTKRVGLVMKTLTNPFFVEMEKGARRAEAELGIELQVKTASQETSIEQQIQIVEDMIADGLDAIVIAPGDSQRLVPVLKKATENGIKLVNIDNRLDVAMLKQSGMKPVPFISVDNMSAAYNSAKYIADTVTVPTQAAILEGIRSADNANQRMNGAKQAFAENSNIQLVASESANWKIDEGYDVTKQIIANHPDIKLIFAANDMMAFGVLKVIQEIEADDIKVASYDALAEAVEEVKAGRLAVTVDQQASEQGYQGVALAVRLLNGDSVPEVMMIDTRLITADAL